ncbi:hypothetical protein BJ742DRAFT_823511 [Cladochytrium replicatum]|nr:hypothetical protein BJ742DRAFT_823511 [Cladochytrium replicatum]
MEPQQRNNSSAQLYLNTERVEYPSPTVPTPLPDSDDDDLPLGLLLERVSTASVLNNRPKPFDVVEPRSSPMSATSVPKYFATSSTSPVPSVLQQRRAERPRSSPVTLRNLNRMESSLSSDQPRTTATGSATCICRITDPPPSYSPIQLVRLACTVSNRTTTEIFVNHDQIAYLIERNGVVGIVSANPRDGEIDADVEAEVLYTVPRGTLSRRADVESFVRKNCVGFVRLESVKLTESECETTSCAMVNPRLVIGVQPGPPSASGKPEPTTIVTLNAVVVPRGGATSYMQLEVHGSLKDVVKQLDPTSARR